MHVSTNPKTRRNVWPTRDLPSFPLNFGRDRVSQFTPEASPGNIPFAARALLHLPNRENITVATTKQALTRGLWRLRSTLPRISLLQVHGKMSFRQASAHPRLHECNMFNYLKTLLPFSHQQALAFSLLSPPSFKWLSVVTCGLGSCHFFTLA
jgi:hypothetical protein